MKSTFDKMPIIIFQFTNKKNTNGKETFNNSDENSVKISYPPNNYPFTKYHTIRKNTTKHNLPNNVSDMTKHSSKIYSNTDLKKKNLNQEIIRIS